MALVSRHGSNDHRSQCAIQIATGGMEFSNSASRPVTTGEMSKSMSFANACGAKFKQHAELRELLLSTGDRVLQEGSPDDRYRIWPDGHGWVMLMELRAPLRERNEAWNDRTYTRCG